MVKIEKYPKNSEVIPKGIDCVLQISVGTGVTTIKGIVSRDEYGIFFEGQVSYMNSTVQYKPDGFKIFWLPFFAEI